MTTVKMPPNVRNKLQNAKIQQSGSPSEGFPPASCCERLWRKSSATADLECQTGKRRRPRRRPEPAAGGTRNSPRAVRRPHAQRSRARSASLKFRRAHTPQPPSAGGFDRVVKLPTRQLRAGAAGRNRWPKGPPSRARGNEKRIGNAAEPAAASAARTQK